MNSAIQAPSGGETFYSFRPFILCPPPIRKLPDGQLRWVAGTANLRVRMSTESGDLPYGQDRLLFILIATEAIRNDSPTIEIGRRSSVLNAFGQGLDGRTYRRLDERIVRVKRSEITFELRSLNEDDRRWRYRFLEKATRSDDSGHGSDILRIPNKLWKALSAGVVPLDAGIVRELARAPAVLDLYQWLVLYSSTVRPGRVLRVPLEGEAGLQSRLWKGEYSRRRDFRRLVGRWMGRIHELWPNCPASLALHKQSILLRPAPPSVIGLG